MKAIFLLLVSVIVLVNGASVKYLRGKGATESLSLLDLSASTVAV
jgi:hypothetical protein